jgi:hypothetical protein
MTAEVDQSAIAYNTGLAYYGDDQVFRNQIYGFEVMTLDPTAEALHMAWKTKNMPEIARLGTKLRAAAG